MQGDEKGTIGALILKMQLAVAKFDDYGLLVIDLARNDGFAQFVEHQSLQRTLHRASTELRIVALTSDIVDGIVSKQQI